MSRDYYEVIGVSRTATVAEIKTSYRKLAMEFHPDRNPDNPEAEDKFKEAAEAYGVLSDTDKRSRYDQFGHAGVNNNHGGGQPFTDINDIFSAFGDVFGSSVFGDVFGGGPGRGRKRSRGEAGADLRVRMPLTLEEIALGVEKTLQMKHYLTCETCSGSGAAEDTDFDTCTACDGAGEVRQVSRSVFGQFINIAPCTNCSGTGEILTHACDTCDGEGRVGGESTVTVTIPKGVRTGNYLTVSEQGHAGRRGGPAGDAVVVIEELEHEHFQREDDDVYTDLVVDFPTAALGGEVEVPTLDGFSMITIKPGSQPGIVMKMKGKGIPHLNSRGSGDQLVRFNVFIPTSLSSDEKETVKSLAESKHFSPDDTSEKSGFFSRVKEAFS